MIPKKIHYCWLSGEPMPERLQECINSWSRIMPDYEVVLWDSNKFNTDAVPYVREACQMGKWAFASDYIRLYALYSEGGIYLDSDVFVRRRLDDFLHHRAFSAVEYHPGIAEERGSKELLSSDGTSKQKGTIISGIGIQAAVLGGVKGHRFFQECLSSYQNRQFILKNGTLNTAVIAPSIFAVVAEDFGFIYRDHKQSLEDGFVVYPSETFAGHLNQASSESYAIHLCAGAWRPRKQRKVIDRAIKKLKKWNALRVLVRKRPIKTKVDYKVASAGRVELEVFSEAGNFLERDVLGMQKKGKYSMTWKSKDLPAGRYICRVRNNSRLIREFYLVKSPLVE